MGALHIGWIISIIIIVLYYSEHLYSKYSVNKRKLVPEAIKLTVLKNMLYLIDDYSNAYGTYYWVTYGTLLGAYRNNKIICYDYDVDVAIMNDQYYAMLAAMKDLVKNNPEYKLSVYNYPLFNYKKIAIFHKATGLNADIMVYKKTGDYISRCIPGIYVKYMQNECDTRYPIDWVFPLKTMYLEGIPVNVPNLSDKVLTCYYGKNFIHPVGVCE